MATGLASRVDGANTLLLRFSGDLSAARETLVGRNGDVHVIRPADIRGGSRGLSVPRADRLAVLGGPPVDEIGYGLTPLVALASRAPVVSIVDAMHGSVRTRSLERYLVEAAPLAGAQLVTGVVALGWQTAVARALKARPSIGGRSAPLERVVYLRPVVGTASAVGGSITHSHEVIRALEAEGIAICPFTTDAAIVATAREQPDASCDWDLVPRPRCARLVPASMAAAGDLALVAAAAHHAGSAQAIYQRHARFSVSGALLSKLTGLPLLLEYNGSEQWVRKHWQPSPFPNLLRECEEASLACAARIVVVSDVERQTLEQSGIEPGRIVVNPCGVDATRFAAGRGEAVRRAAGFSGDAVVVGFVGTFGTWHGVPVLARAFISIAARLPEARLLLVGAGPELESVRTTLAGLEAQGRVVFAQPIHPSRVPDHLAACDILTSPHVWPSDAGRFFGSPTKLFEYMAAGRAVVASALEQIAAVLEHERTALLIEPGDERQLADAIVRLAHDTELRDRLGEAARREAADRHSWRRNARIVTEAYESLSPAARVAP